MVFNRMRRAYSQLEFLGVGASSLYFMDVVVLASGALEVKYLVLRA